jgi:hypothetical protein
MKRKLTSPKCYYQLFTIIIQYVLNPTVKEKVGLKNHEKIIDTLILLIINFLLAAAAIAISFNLRPKNLGISHIEDIYPPAIQFLLLAIVLPLMEETAFRLYLKFKPIFLSLSISMSTYYITTINIFNTYTTDFNNGFLIRVSVSILLGSIAFIILKKNAQYISRFWKNHFRWIFYFSIVVFGLVHIINYELNIRNILLGPIIVLPQLISGTFLGFIRIKYGFIYGYTAHILNNSIAFLMLNLILNL